MRPYGFNCGAHIHDLDSCPCIGQIPPLVGAVLITRRAMDGGHGEGVVPFGHMSIRRGGNPQTVPPPKQNTAFKNINGNNINLPKKIANHVIQTLELCCLITSFHMKMEISVSRRFLFWYRDLVWDDDKKQSVWCLETYSTASKTPPPVGTTICGLHLGHWNSMVGNLRMLFLWKNQKFALRRNPSQMWSKAEFVDIHII